MTHAMASGSLAEVIQNRRMAVLEAPSPGDCAKEAPAPCHGLFRGSGSHQKAHQQSEIMPGDMDQVALVNILTTAQPSSPHAAPIQDVGEGPLDDLGPLAHGLFADARLQTGAIVVDRPARLFVPVPAGKCRAPRLGDPGRPGATVQAFQKGIISNSAEQNLP